MQAFLDALRAHPEILRASGVLGSIIYVGGFALVQYGKACGNGRLYSVSKIFAASLVLISLVGAFNLGAFLIQIGFIFFGIMGVIRQNNTVGPNGAAASMTTASRAHAHPAPQPQDSSPRIFDWQMRPPAQGDGRSIQPCPAFAPPKL